MKSANLDSVIEREAEIGTYKIGAALTPADAIPLIEQAIKIVAVVAIAPGSGWHFELDKARALQVVKRLRPDTRIMCDLESDGWCWIGTTVN